MKISKKLYLSLFVMTFFAVIIGLIGYLALNQTEKRCETSMEDITNVAEVASMIHINILKTLHTEKDYLLNYKKLGLKEAKQKFVTNGFIPLIEKTLQLTEKAKVQEAKHRHADDIERINNLVHELNNYSLLFNQAIEKIHQKGYENYGLIGKYRTSCHELEKIFDNQQAQTEDIIRLENLLLKCRRAEKDYFLRDDVKYIDKFKSYMTTLKKNIKSSISLSEQAKSKCLELEAKAQKSLNSIIKINEQIKDIKQVYTESAHKILNITDEVYSEGMYMAEEEIKQAIELGSKSSNLMIICIILTIIAGLVISTIYTKQYTRPLIKLINAVEKIREKDLNINIDIKSNDEVGSLADAFNYMLESLRQQIIDIATGSTELSSSITEISATSTQLATSTAESTTSMTEISATIEQMKQITQTTCNKALEVSENSKNVAKIFSDGQVATEKNIEGMNKINEEMNYIAQSTIRLGEQTQNIGDIINSVSGLADQTNLLSVNASIEAAKAGEYGKGFAVVAKEVKTLAEQSREATKQISAILTDIQKASSAAILATERGNKAVKSGLELSKMAGTTIEALNNNILEATESSIKISASNQQQLTGMEQLFSSISNIQEALVQNSYSSKQLEESAQSLTQLSQKLQDMANTFNIVSSETKIFHEEKVNDYETKK